MKEAELTQGLLAELRGRGFFVMKHCDRISKGIPDLSASRDGITTWLECKAVRLKTFKSEVCWRPIIDNKVQLATMLALERSARARYVLFEIVGRRHKTFWCLPSVVAFSVTSESEVVLGEVGL